MHDKAANRASVLMVTPYYKESREMLERCIRSVAAQTIPADHLLVADGFGLDWIDSENVRHLRLDRAHENYGNTPRALGILMGIGEGYEAIGLLDADNWLDADHVQTCLDTARHAPECDYVVSLRRLMRIDGTEMPIQDEPVEQHVDTSCFFFLEGSFAILPLWGTMPNPVSPICDRIFYTAVKEKGLRQALTNRTTVNFQVTVRGFYQRLREEPPPGTKDGPDMDAMLRWLDGLDDAASANADQRAGIRLRGTNNCPVRSD